MVGFGSRDDEFTGILVDFVEPYAFLKQYLRVNQCGLVSKELRAFFKAIFEVFSCQLFEGLIAI